MVIWQHRNKEDWITKRGFKTIDYIRNTRQTEPYYVLKHVYRSHHPLLQYYHRHKTFCINITYMKHTTFWNRTVHNVSWESKNTCSESWKGKSSLNQTLIQKYPVSNISNFKTRSPPFAIYTCNTSLGWPMMECEGYILWGFRSHWLKTPMFIIHCLSPWTGSYSMALP